MTRAAALDDRRAVLARRADEPWFVTASAALDSVAAGLEVDWDALVPPTYGHWDDLARAHHSRGNARRNDEAGAVFAEGAFDNSPVLVLAGDASAFPTATFTVPPGCGPFPWLDDPSALQEATTRFLERSGDVEQDAESLFDG